MPVTKQQLIDALSPNVSLTEQTLPNGETSPIGLNTLISVFSPNLMTIGDYFCQELAAYEGVMQAVGSMNAGALPLVMATQMCEKMHGQTLNSFYNVNGTQQIVGALLPGQKAILIEDVSATGEAILATAAAVEAFGAEVLAIMILIDAGGSTAVEAAGYTCNSFTVTGDYE